MLSTIHKVLGRSAAALFSVMVASVTFGGETVRLKIAEAATAIYSDPSARTAVIVVLIAWLVGWYVTKPYVWKRLQRLRKWPPIAYLRNTTNRGGHRGQKVFSIVWRADALAVKFNGDSSNMLSQVEPTEKTLTFNLFNAGDVAIRHVEIRWRLPGVNISKLIKSTDLFGESLKSASKGELRLVRDGGGGIIPYRTDATSGPIPIIGGGNAVDVEAPEDFTLAYSICALARAKSNNDKNIELVVSDPIEHLDKLQVRMDDALVQLSYVTGGRKRRHSFRITGWVMGGSKPLVQREKEGTEAYFEHTEGVVASVDHVEAISE